MKNTLVVTAATAFLFAALNAASAGEPLLSPKGKELQIKKVAGVSQDKIDRSVQTAPPKVAELRHSVRTVPGQTADLLARQTPTVPPRLLSNEPWRLQEFQVAPLK